MFSNIFCKILKIKCFCNEIGFITPSFVLRSLFIFLSEICNPRCFKLSRAFSRSLPLLLIASTHSLSPRLVSLRSSATSSTFAIFILYFILFSILSAFVYKANFKRLNKTLKLLINCSVFIYQKINFN